MVRGSVSRGLVVEGNGLGLGFLGFLGCELSDWVCVCDSDEAHLWRKHHPTRFLHHVVMSMSQGPAGVPSPAEQLSVGLHGEAVTTPRYDGSAPVLSPFEADTQQGVDYLGVRVWVWVWVSE